MGFQVGLSGLSSSSRNLDVIGNNIANSNTVGFKNSRAEFADVYAAQLNGAGAGDIGIGTRRAPAPSQQFSQGNFSTTDNPLDLAINGQGFFRLENPDGTIAYSRNGQFRLDNQGYIVNSSNDRLTGRGLLPDGSAVDPNSPMIALQIDNSDLQATPTTDATIGANLDSRNSPSTLVTPFDPTNPRTYHSSTSMQVYDSLGQAHTVTFYFRKTDDATNAWAMQAFEGANDLTGGDFPMTFTGAGLVASGGNVVLNPFTPPGANPVTLEVDLSNMTQFSNRFSVSTLEQNGYTSGKINGFTVEDDGTISGRYTNGQVRALGQLVLANFASVQNLQPSGSNKWLETAASGAAVINNPGTSNLGLINDATLEDSNVDLTQELVNMITAQRAYQANAQTIRTQDQILQTVVNLR